MKYQKSDWYRGLLEAERMIQEGWEYGSNTLHQVKFKYGEAVCIFYAIRDDDLFNSGCLDYVRHIKENK